ncbi:MAG: hypothetical protein ACP6IU_12570, partial [Candidatus Asgardarchaeia archaeon]
MLIDTPLVDAKTCYLYKSIKRHARRKRSTSSGKKQAKRERKRGRKKKSGKKRSKRPVLIAAGDIDDLLPNHPQMWRPY